MRVRRFSFLPILLSLAATGVGSRPAAADTAAADALPPARGLAHPGPAALLDATLTPEQLRERAFLEHLGWRFVTDPSVRTITMAGGVPCRHSNLAASHAAGDLRVLFPPTVTQAEVAKLGASLDDVANSIATRCAWQLLIAPAVERAAAKLSENQARGFWVFPHWGPIPAPIFSMDPPATAWVRIKKEKICRAREKPSAAIEAFYTQRASTECYVGQTLASYAIQYEVYGAAWFDAVFAPEEIAIGQVEHFHKTPLGHSMSSPDDYPWRALFLRPDEMEEDPGIVLARLGPLAFPGLTGILMDQFGRSRSNQNFTFVSVTAEAADWLVKNGGFGSIAERTRELLALEMTPRRPFVTGADLLAVQAREDAIFAEPVFRGVRLYIHPYGVKTLGEMLDKLRRKDRTAVELILYDEAREDTFFQRYRGAWKARWSASIAARGVQR